MAEFMAAFAARHPAVRGVGDEQMRRDRQQDRLVPGHAILERRDHLVEAVIILVGTHDPLGVMPGQLPLDEVGDHFLAVDAHSPASISKSSGRFQNSVNSARKREESRIASRYISRTSGAKSLAATRLPCSSSHSETGLARARRSSIFFFRSAAVA